MLIQEDAAVKPGEQAVTILLAVGFFVAAVFAGLAGWLANSQRYYQESLAVGKGGSEKGGWSGLLKAIQLACFFVLPAFFFLGVFFAGLYIILRTLNCCSGHMMSELFCLFGSSSRL
jgi:hypothetical protein